jgi:glutathione peroxidase
MGDKINQMKKLKRFVIVLFIFIAAFAVYVEIVNRNSTNMTYRQKILKAVYPALMWISKLTGKNAKELSGSKQPLISFYTLKGVLNDGTVLDFATLKGKKVVLVNTASECGYTDQYETLQQLAEQYKDKLVVLGFPANDFKEQEKGTDEQIAAFCKKNYGVTFPLMQKSIVVKSPQQNSIYQWLTEEVKNGWNNKVPSWNFSKYVVNEQGVLTNYFGPSISPTGNEMLKVIED